MLDDKEKQALGQVFDLALKQGGIQIISNVNYFISKFGLVEQQKEEVKGKK